MDRKIDAHFNDRRIGVGDAQFVDTGVFESFLSILKRRIVSLKVRILEMSLRRDAVAM